MLLDFLVTVVFVFILSSLLLMLAHRPPFPETLNEEGNPDAIEQRPELEELAEAISQDEDLLAPPPPIEVPHVNLPGAKLGGGAAGELCSKTTGSIALKLVDTEDEKRKYNRRLRERRVSDDLMKDDKRLVQRRVWLRREEDRRGKRLLPIKDAADTLGVSVEQMYKWLDDTDVPFYQVTDGKRKAIRFEIGELLEWFSAFIPQDRKL